MKIFFVSIVAVVLLIIGFIIWASIFGPGPILATPIEGVQKYTVTGRSHTTGIVKYDQTPPVGGNHAPVWAACNGNVYTTAIPNEQAVHSLEHGAVWVTYQPSVGNAAIDSLSKKVRAHAYTFMSPLPEEKSPIVLTAWNTQLSLESADDPRIDQFLKQFPQGPQTPERGATCAPASGGVQ